MFIKGMNLLFVCVGNSCRSQMAEGLAKSMGFEAASAGTHPAQAVAQHAITLLNSKGISTDGMTPKSLDEFNPEAFDMVISMGCGVHCPAIKIDQDWDCLLYTSPSPRDKRQSRMPSSA